MEFFLLKKSREVTPIKKNIWQNVILVIFRISSGLCLKTQKMSNFLCERKTLFSNIFM